MDSQATSVALLDTLQAMRPEGWAIAPAYFLEFSLDSLRKQYAFYEKAYGVPTVEQVSKRVFEKMEYLRNAIDLVEGSCTDGSIATVTIATPIEGATAAPKVQYVLGL